MQHSRQRFAPPKSDSSESAGRKHQGRFGFSRVARHRLENRLLWPILYFKGGASMTVV